MPSGSVGTATVLTIARVGVGVTAGVTVGVAIGVAAVVVVAHLIHVIWITAQFCRHAHAPDAPLRAAGGTAHLG